MQHRVKRVVLPAEQRRLRHVKSVSARSLVSLSATEPLLDAYFTLHESSNGSAFYTSEVITSTANPTWRTFDCSLLPSHINQATARFIVRVWGGSHVSFGTEPTTTKPPAVMSTSTESQWNGDSDVCEEKDTCGKNCRSLETTSKSLIYTVSQMGRFKLLLECDVTLYGLEYIGTSLHEDNVPFGHNTIVFGLKDGFYFTSAPENSSNVRNEEDAGDDEEDLTNGNGPNGYVDGAINGGSPVDLLLTMLKVEKYKVKRTYSFFSLSRIHTLVQSIQQLQRYVAETKAQTEVALKKKMESNATAHRIAELRRRVAFLRDEAIYRRNDLSNAQSRAFLLRNQLSERALSLSHGRLALDTDVRQVINRRHKLVERREMLKRTNTLVDLRRSQLIIQLHSIYPIESIPASPKALTICHLPLPNSDYAGVDEELVATALGCVCHLVFMVAKYLELPLRYPMLPMSSRSTIRDNIFHEVTPTFPLYPKGMLNNRKVEKFKFEFGVFLLNKNIEQLMNFCGFSVTDLRNTLPNLKTLLQSENMLVFDHGMSGGAVSGSTVTIGTSVNVNAGYLGASANRNGIGDGGSRHCKTSSSASDLMRKSIIDEDSSSTSATAFLPSRNRATTTR